MAEAKIFAGPRVRRIRTGLDLTQTAMAEVLEISPSYLNLIERNQRPLTAQLVLKMVARFQVDPEQLQPAESGSAIAALREVFSDPLLSSELPGNTELLELADSAPNAAQAMVKLHRAYREQQQRLSDLMALVGQGGHLGVSQQGDAGGLAASISQPMPTDQVRGLFEDRPWCFPGLERAAERVLATLGEDGPRMASLYYRLRAEHGIAVQVLPVETMPNLRRRYDRHSKRLFISERLPRPERAELLVRELIRLQESEAITEEVELLGLRDNEARRLATAEFTRYAALAVLMPYARFLRICERVGFDPSVLATRFEMGLWQVAQRLVSMQDRSDGRRAGLPFFALEIDQRGTVLRRIGAKGFPRALFGGDCPKLAVHAAFSRPGEIIAERVVNTSGDVFLTLAGTAAGPDTGAGERPRRTGVLLGLEDKHAQALLEASSAVQTTKPGGATDTVEKKRGPIVFEKDDVVARTLVHARILPDPLIAPPIAIGPACRLCEREDCVARTAPPLTQPVGLDDASEGFGTFGLG
ncbi:MAG: short-chain fatty acyl-CoA regulator family protein [Pseudomonadota bacterium]